MAKKSGLQKETDNREWITREQMETELTAMWGFNPYQILTGHPAIRRLENFVAWKCLNCNHQFAINFAGLEALRNEKGYYCPKCQGNENPANKSEKIDSEKEKSADKMKGVFTMTVKEIVDLAKNDKLVGYPDENNIRWGEEHRADFREFLLNGSDFGLFFQFIQRPGGIYEVFDGKQRISLLLQLLEKCDKQESEKIEKLACKIFILTDAAIAELKELEKKEKMKLCLNEPEEREGVLTLEKRGFIKNMVEHDFFKNCLILGNNNNLADRDFAMILLAFCCANLPQEPDIKTLPCNLLKFASEDILDDMEYDFYNLSMNVLDLMNHMFSNTNFICRAVDFCYIAALYLWFEHGLTYRKIKEEDYKTLYEEYVHMWSKLAPCVTLNPLARESLEKVQIYFKDMILRVFDPEFARI
jgi:DNA-directed RNA polymerase subunit RPC12/RpoP